MSIIRPEIEYVDRSTESLRYLEHGWPTDLCRWHSHEVYEIHLILETKGKAFVGDYVGEFRPGSLYLVGPNLPHNWVTDKADTSEIETRDMLVQFHQDSMDLALRAFPEFRELKDMLEQARRGIQFEGFDAGLAKGYLERIRDMSGFARVLEFLSFLKVLAQHPNRQSLSVMQLTQPAAGKKQEQIADVVDYVVRNYSEEFSVTEAASMAGMSEASFSRNFQTVTGNRFTEFVNRIRIGQSCVLLFETDEQISSICFDVGFQNLANFNRHFLKMKKMTPSEFRSAARISLIQNSDPISKRPQA